MSVVQLHVNAKTVEGMRKELEKNYRENFLPTISRQEGFRACYLLTDMEDADCCEILISFDSESSREKWVTSDDHQAVWPEIKKCLVDIMDIGFDVIAGSTVLDV